MNASDHAPAISVVMAAFNVEKHLCSAIESILDQTFRDFEFIIVDDGSQDGTWEIVQEYASRDPRVRSLRNERNRGFPASLNRGLKAARSEWIARMDADDIACPERLARQMAFLAEHPAVDVLGAGTILLENGTLKPDIFKPQLHHSPILWDLIFDRGVTHATTLLRRSKILEVGGYDTAALHAEDLDLWLRLAGRVRFANLPDVLYQYRILQTSTSRSRRIEQAYKAAWLRARFAERVLGENVPVENLSDLKQGNRQFLSAGRCAELSAFLDSLFNAMCRAGLIRGEEVALVRVDLDRRLAGLQERATGIQTASLQERLRVALPRPLYVGVMGLLQPRVAWRKAKAMREARKQK